MARSIYMLIGGRAVRSSGSWKVVASPLDGCSMKFAKRVHERSPWNVQGANKTKKVRGCKHDRHLGKPRSPLVPPRSRSPSYGAHTVLASSSAQQSNPSATAYALARIKGAQWTWHYTSNGRLPSSSVTSSLVHSSSSSSTPEAVGLTA